MFKVAMLALALATTAAHARPITEDEKALVQESVGHMLKDPSSAQYRWQENVAENGEYCGHVNAKNGYGGYVGFQAFRVVITQGAPPTVNVVWVASPRQVYRTCPR